MHPSASNFRPLQTDQVSSRVETDWKGLLALGLRSRASYRGPNGEIEFDQFVAKVSPFIEQSQATAFVVTWRNGDLYPAINFSAYSGAPAVTVDNGKVKVVDNGEVVGDFFGIRPAKSGVEGLGLMIIYAPGVRL